MKFLKQFCVKKFLFFFSLETGGAVIGYFEFLSSLFFFVKDVLSKHRLPVQFESKNFYYERLDLIIIFSIILLSCILLIVGVSKRNHFLLLPWMVTEVIFSGLVIFIILMYSLVWPNNQMFFESDAKIYGIGFIVYSLYSWYIIYLLFHVYAKELRARIKSAGRNESHEILSEILTEDSVSDED